MNILPTPYRLPAVMCWISLSAIFSLHAAEPAWWASRGVKSSGAPAYDFAPATQGQLKLMATAAMAELDANAPQHASAAIHNIVDPWQHDPITHAPNPNAKDFAVVTLGQLKYVSAPFYDQLALSYPWTSDATDNNDYAIANLGQLKFVFSFDLSQPATPVTAVAQTLTLDEDGGLGITLTATPGDVPNLAYRAITQPAHGVLVGAAPNLTYYPDAHYSGPDSFDFRVIQGIHTSDATISLTVAPVNDAPLVSMAPNVFTVTADSSGVATLALTGSVSDVDSPPDTLTCKWSQDSGAGIVAFSPAESITTSVTYPDAAHPGATPYQAATTATFPQTGTTYPREYTLRLSARDGHATRSDSFTVKVLAPTHPAAPAVSIVASSPAISPGENVTLTASVTGTVTGVDFYEGNRLIGSDSTAPYTIDWQSSQTGWYAFTATAYNTAASLGHSAAAAVVRVAYTLGGPPGNAAPGNNGHSASGGDGGVTPGTLPNTGGGPDDGSNNGSNNGSGGGSGGGSRNNADDDQSDDDDDGLSQSEEDEIGTDPSNPDTDGDGVKDGDDGWAGGTDVTEESKFAPPRLPLPHYAVIDIAEVDESGGGFDKLLLNDKGTVVWSRPLEAGSGRRKVERWDPGTGEVTTVQEGTGAESEESCFVPLAMNNNGDLAGYTYVAEDGHPGINPYTGRPTEAVAGSNVKPAKRPGPLNDSVESFPTDAFVFTGDVHGYESWDCGGWANDINDAGLSVGMAHIDIDVSSSSLRYTVSYDDYPPQIPSFEGDGFAGMSWPGGDIIDGGHIVNPDWMTHTTTPTFFPYAIAPDTDEAIMFGLKLTYDGYGVPDGESVEIRPGSGSPTTVWNWTSPGVSPFRTVEFPEGRFTKSGHLLLELARWNPYWEPDDEIPPLEGEDSIWLKDEGQTSYVEAKVKTKDKDGASIELIDLNDRMQGITSYSLWQNYKEYPLEGLLKDVITTADGKKKWKDFQAYSINEGGAILVVATKDENNDGVFDRGTYPDYNGPDKRHVVLLPNVRMNWEALPNYENVEDNKKVAEVDANDAPKTRVWMAGRGSRIFPDKKNPDDNSPNRNRCILRIKTGLPGQTIYLKSFDVDDATPDSVDNDPSNKIDIDAKGDDNKDTIFPKSGKFVSSSSNTATVTLDSNGEAQVQFETTKQPGDNFRVALAFKQEDLAGLKVNNPGGDGFVDGDSDKQVKGFNGVVSPMLTVWRRLWCEFDSMGPPSQQFDGHENFEDVEVGTENAYQEDHPSEGQSILGVSPALSEGDNRFENGKLYVGGVSYKIISNNTQDATVTIEGKPGLSVLGTSVRAYDDDVSDLGTSSPNPPITLPYQLTGGKLIYTAFADAYIEPIKAPASAIQTDVPFKRNIDYILYPTQWEPTVSSHRTLSNTNDLWTAYCLCAWQGAYYADHDPDDEESDLGLTDPFGVNQSAIYIEPIRESEGNPIYPRISEQHTVVHEIGHQGGGKHTDEGIMAKGAPIGNDFFKPITIKRFRENQLYHHQLLP